MSISEREFLNQVMQLAKLHGWRVCHFRPALTRGGRWLTAMSGDVGFPDLVLARNRNGKPQLIFAELKVGKNKATAEQTAWLAVLSPSALVYTWRPEDWDAIVTTLE